MATRFMIDVANAPSDEQLAQIKAKGVDVVAMYYFRGTSWKDRLDNPTAQRIVAAGMRVVSLWESGSPTSDAYFSDAFTQGQSDAQDAHDQAQTARQPHGSKIYFCVDYDTPISFFPTIAEYFRGVRTTLYKVSYDGTNNYWPSCYGSGALLQYLFQKGLIHGKGMLCESEGYAGREIWRPVADIVQLAEVKNFCGLDVDTNTIQGDAGDWIPVA